MINQTLFQSSTTATNASRIDNNLLVSHNIWVVSFLRRKKSQNPRHAFIVLEGINEVGKGILRRYDLVVNRNDENKGEVNIINLNDIRLVTMHQQLEQLVRLQDDNDELLYLSWPITRQKAYELHAAIEEDKQKEINYSVLGKHSISVSKDAHNCFSWAREKLNSLKDSKTDIDIPVKPTDYLAADPSLYLGEPTSKNCLIM